MTTELYHNICDYLSQLILGTEWEGHIYAVGGCCPGYYTHLTLPTNREVYN